MKLKIEKVLVVSNHHLTKYDHIFLSALSYNECLPSFLEVHGSSGSFENFWLIPLKQDFRNLPGKLPDSLRKILMFAKKHKEKFTHIKFEEGGSKLEGFETFEC